MANEFKHLAVGTELTQSEYESVGGHVLDSQAVGDIIYASSTSQLSRLGIGSTGAVLTVTGGIPAWDTTWTPTGHLIPASDDTYDLGSASAAWQDLFLEGDITLTDAGTISTTAGSLSLTPASGSAIVLDGTISIDAGVVTGATSITSTAFVGDITGDVTGNADTATLATTVTATANNSTDETVYPTFVDGATSAQGIETDTGLTYNPSSGVLTSTSFTGALTGNVTGNVSGTAATVTSGTQASITTLANVTTVGALDAGSISTNFGAINNGSSAITTTGLVSAGSLTVTGTTTLNGNVTLGSDADDVITVNGTVAGANAVVFEGNTADGSETTLAVVDPTSDHTVYMPNQGGYLGVFAAASTTQISSTPEELNLLDGDTAVGASITIADSDGFVVNDGGVMKTIPASDINTYVGDIDTTYTAGALLDLVGTQFDVDLTEAAEAAIADGDYILFLDGGATGTQSKEAVHDLATLFAGTGLTATSSVLAVDASQTQITAVGTIGNGTWEATDIGVEHGGTGVSSFTDAGVLIGNGTGAVQATSAGTSGQVLTSNGAGVDPTFQDAAGGGGGATFLSKPADETVNNSTTLQNDDDLTFSVSANKEYAVWGVLYMNSPGNADMKFAWSVPAAATLYTIGLNQGATGFWDIDQDGEFIPTTGSAQTFEFTGTLIVGANAGTAVLQFAQWTAQAADSDLLKGTWLAYKELD